MSGQNSTNTLIEEDEVNVDSLIKQSYQSFLDLTRISRKLPIPGEDYEYYSSFPGYRIFCDKMKQKITNMQNRLSTGISTVLPRYNKSLSQANSSSYVDIDELFDKLVETNDSGLEHVAQLLDFLSYPPISDPPNYSSLAYPSKIITDSISSHTQSTSDIPKWNQNLQIINRTKTESSIKIEKPQLKFSRSPDNSNSPFIPYLVKNIKPNALPVIPIVSSIPYSNSLDGLLSGIREEDSLKLHPYYYELQALNFNEMEMQIR